MAIVEAGVKAAEAAGKAAGKAIGSATKAAGSAAANATKTAGNAAANATKAGANLANSGLKAGANGLNSLGKSGIGNKPSGLGGKNGLGNGNHGLGNNGRGLGGNQGVGNNSNGLGKNRKLGNELGKNEKNLHKKGNNSLLDRKNPLSPKNYFQRVKQQKQKMEDRGEDASGVLPYIKALPFIIKIYITCAISFLVFIIFGVSVMASMSKTDFISDTIASGAITGITSSTVTVAPVQISNPSPAVSSYISSNVSSQYQNVAQNLGHNQTATTHDGTPVSDEELLYYQKIADISFRYKQLYNIELDWVLITTANLYVFNSNGDFYESNIGGYNSSDVVNLDETMSLDWDFDYKDIDGYLYLVDGDYKYDLQILAKNMVTKKTTQQCISGTTVLETKEVYDIEDEKLDEENPEYLECTTGTYNVINEYKLDKAKFDEFLLEYLDSRFYGVNGSKAPGSSSGGGQSSAPSTGKWGWPLPAGASSCRSSVYGYRVHPITGKVHYHSGDDYPAAGGTPVYSIGDGTVIAVNTGCTPGNTNCGGGAGNYVKIDHGGGVVSIYMHASRVLVTKGQHVSRGQEIMKVGTTGSSTGNHLHITIRLNGQLDDPKNYIGALPAC